MGFRAALFRLLAVTVFMAAVGLWPGAVSIANAMPQPQRAQAISTPDCHSMTADRMNETCRQHCLGQTVMTEAFAPPGLMQRVVPFEPAPVLAFAASTGPEPEGKPPRL
jgi:hypothetical protein